ncbi:unnamed protein product (macronuclear) [Paramecium tetraurelia]|uniref:Transmembrane protein n=1 Tax=Paramecium tetraurelia TaxID=5888 RepID=A0DHU8_PARTE|nr:uncharacterized protein GSPATT00017002001 [Paramecium tetraurelia]CAK82615.1 unnamed protein product [Paramecium tetraurelia]|eukprot:XP_001450012.1 hypothetical protein (macronuclear) [Paramecium tetraurelia strain d4-2]
MNIDYNDCESKENMKILSMMLSIQLCNPLIQSILLCQRMIFELLFWWIQLCILYKKILKTKSMQNRNCNQPSKIQLKMLQYSEGVQQEKQIAKITQQKNYQPIERGKQTVNSIKLQIIREQFQEQYNYFDPQVLLQFYSQITQFRQR